MVDYRRMSPKPLFIDCPIDEQPSCLKSYITSISIPWKHEDYKLAWYYLNMYIGSKDTFTAYRREIEKLFQWAWLIEKQPVRYVNRDHILKYLTFIQSPPKYWIGTKTVARLTKGPLDEKIFNPDWRPFVVRLSKQAIRDGQTPRKDQFKLKNRSIQALFASLSSFFNYLMQEEVTTSNPIALIRQKNALIQRQQEQKVTRRLSDEQWQYVINVVSEKALEDPLAIRSLFIMACFFLMGLRISEMSQTPGRTPTMGDFAPDKNGLWWFNAIGKGNKSRDIAVPDELLKILKLYRKSLGLPPLPHRGEETPMISHNNSSKSLGTRQIRNIVQQCFDDAIERMVLEKKSDESEDLKAATVHWLRHTSISYDVTFRPREHVRDDAGHENPSTTERYIDTDRIARHLSAKEKKLNPFIKKN